VRPKGECRNIRGSRVELGSEKGARGSRKSEERSGTLTEEVFEIESLIKVPVGENRRGGG